MPSTLAPRSTPPGGLEEEREETEEERKEREHRNYLGDTDNDADEDDELSYDSSDPKGKKRIEKTKAARKTANMVVTGQIPVFWGVVTPNDVPERDNTFQHMLSRHLYASRFDNTVYAGQSAIVAAELEADTNQRAGTSVGEV